MLSLKLLNINTPTMRKSSIQMIIGLAIVLMAVGCTKAIPDSSLFAALEDTRSTFLLDEDWKFHLGEMEGGEVPELDDKSWRNLNLPHDWSIEDIPGTGSPLDSTAVGAINTGYFRGGAAWYRKQLDVPEGLESKRFFLQFDGIYMDADIWINGIHLGNHPYGYTSFWYDITDQVMVGESNLIAVRIRNEGRNSRWYTGSGIYRHVWLTVTEPVHIAPWGTSITTPEIFSDRATVLVANEITSFNSSKGKLKVLTTILNEAGETVAQSENEIGFTPGASEKISQELEITSPDLWSLDSPVLYTAVTEIIGGKSKLLDRVENRFGIRSIKFTQVGFLLNGEKVLLKGGCMHHDNGPLGSAAYDRAEERRVELMKASGFNSIRCAHNPPSPAFLDACDRLGILVIDESFDMWSLPKNPQDYHRFFEDWWKKDVKSMVQRDRNHPSIIMWSTGNEIPERGSPEGVETSALLAEYIRKLDPTRPVTSAVNGLGPDKDPYFATLDLSGYNYSFGGDHGKESIFRIDRKRVPDRIMYCAESYPLTAFGAWMDVLDNPYVIGDFVWTGFDYLGEASIGWLGYLHIGSFYPWNHAYCGDIDICGWKRPQSWYRNVLWKNGKQLSIFVKPPEPSFEENPDRMDWSKWHWQDVVDSWNWDGHEGESLEVEVYCAHETVELFLNGVTLGRKATSRENEWIARWTVPYTAGKLTAIGYRSGEEAESDELLTTGDPANIAMKEDRSSLMADGQDLSFVDVELLDHDGNRSYNAGNLVQFELEGPGEIVAVGSSNPMSTESYQASFRKAYQGRCLVVVKTTREAGEIILTASSEGLQSATLSLESQ
jgi:beta-galactosidase